MDSEVGIHGELWVDDISAGTPDAPGVGALAAEPPRVNNRHWGPLNQEREGRRNTDAPLTRSRRTNGDGQRRGNRKTHHRQALGRFSSRTAKTPVGQELLTLSAGDWGSFGQPQKLCLPGSFRSRCRTVQPVLQRGGR